MALRDEIMTIETEIKSVFPDATFYRQNMPLKHKPHEITIEALSSEMKTETTYHNTRSRPFRVCYFGTSEIAVMEAMEKLEFLFLDRLKIAVSGGHFLSIADFSFSQGFETETEGVYCAIGILKVTSNEARTQHEYEKIRSVSYGL